MFFKNNQFLRNKSFLQLHYLKKFNRCKRRSHYKIFSRKLSNLNNYDPMSVVHLKYLIKILKRDIKVSSKGNIILSYGKNFKKSSIDVEYLENYSEYMDGNVVKIGHFTLQNGKDVSAGKNVSNDCLLRVIYAQTGIEPNKLRREIMRNVRKLKSKCPVKNFICRSKSPVPITIDIIGGAKYHGTSKTQAKNILNKSQAGMSHPKMEQGHPRGHASYPQATGSKDSVENYSENRYRTGFFSRSDQDFVAHYALITNESQDAMELLNEKRARGIKEVVIIPAKNLWIDEDRLPNVQNWYRGEKIGESGRIKDVVVVMKHFYEKYDSEQADVFILTFYPRL